MGLADFLFRSEKKRQLKKLEVTADKIEKLSDKYGAMSDEELSAQTAALKARYAAGETLDELLPDAFAVVREAGARVLNMRHFHVQLLGGTLKIEWTKEGDVFMTGPAAVVCTGEIEI